MKIIFFAFSIICATFFILNNSAIAKSISNEADTEIIENIGKEVSDSNLRQNLETNNSIEDIFGDEQTFPFVAGLGKNAAH